MPTQNFLDIRQSVYRNILQQLFPNVPSHTVDVLLQSINFDLTSPLRVDAEAIPSLTVTVGPGIVSNTISNRQRSIPHIVNSIPNFTSGTIVFPSSNGGTIVVSPGSSLVLNCPSNNYVQVLISLDSSGNLVVTLGTPNVVQASALVPAVPPNTLSFAYITLFNNAGTINSIQQQNIYQLIGVGGSSSSIQSGFAQEVALLSGSTSKVVTFPSSLPGSDYVVIPTLVNTTDPNPEFQDITITNKTNNGFTATWNAPLDSSNYLLDYVVPTVQEQVGEASVSLGSTSITVSIPIAQSGTNYVVIADLINLVDSSPQFQPVDITAKTTTTFTATWNAPTDSANYRLAFHLAQYQ